MQHSSSNWKAFLTICTLTNLVNYQIWRLITSIVKLRLSNALDYCRPLERAYIWAANGHRKGFRGDFWEKELLDQFVSVKRAEPMKMGSIFYINQPGGLHQIEWIRHLWGNDLALTRKPFSSHFMKSNGNLGSRLSSVSYNTRLPGVKLFF